MLDNLNRNTSILSDIQFDRKGLHMSVVQTVDLVVHNVFVQTFAMC